ncbi:MAG: hypothetical protein M8357_09770 [Desulfobulbaceae bacterium]|nr:hypothetical protein [Desulfobulbaceae bacterium]
MNEKFIKKSFKTLHREIDDHLSGGKQGLTVSIPVGEHLFPASLPPRLEMVLLDPEEMIVAYRKVADAGGISRKKGEWYVGPSAAAAEKLLAWIDQMISCKTGTGFYEVEEI